MLVLSLKAGGTGLNLTAASHVVLYDRWWNPAVEDQARDRAWRIGQTRTVICHRLICPGHRRRTGRRSRRRQAPHRRPRAAEVEFARRPRQRAAAPRARIAARRGAVGRRHRGARVMAEQQNRRRGGRAQHEEPRRRRRPSSGARGTDDDVDVVRPADDPTALVRSLGRPPLPGRRDDRRALLRRDVRTGRDVVACAGRGVEPLSHRRRRLTPVVRCRRLRAELPQE